MRRDLVAALALRALVIPQGLAYAQLAGMPPQTGLYTALAAMVAYAVFGTSRYGASRQPHPAYGPSALASSVPRWSC